MCAWRQGEILKFRVDKMGEDGRGVLLLHYTFRKKGKTQQYKNWKEGFKASKGIWELVKNIIGF